MISAVVQVPFSGYGQLNQTGTGLRQRTYARSFIFADPADLTSSFIYVVLDTQSGDTAVRHGILQGFKTLEENMRILENIMSLCVAHTSTLGQGGG